MPWKMYINLYTFPLNLSLLLLFSRSVLSDSLQPHGLQHARLPCPSPSPIACSNAYPLSRRYHPTILSAVIPFLILSKGNWDSHKEFTFWNTATYPQPGTYQECGEAAHLEVSREKDQEEQGEAPPQGKSWRFGQHWGQDREDVCETQGQGQANRKQRNQEGEGLLQEPSGDKEVLI